MIGKINWYSAEKRFGFITAKPESKEKESRDYFFHANDVLDMSVPEAGDKVSFELGERFGRVKAIKVRMTNE